MYIIQRIHFTKFETSNYILDAKYYLSAKSFWENSGNVHCIIIIIIILYLTIHTDEVLQLSAVKKSVMRRKKFEKRFKIQK